MNSADELCKNQKINCFGQENVEKVDFGFGQFVKTGNDLTECTVSVNDKYFVAKFDPGPTGIQPHNFVLANGKQLDITSYSIPDENYFGWIKAR